MGWVISPFLTEEHIKILHKEKLLDELSNCSKPVVLDKITEYLQNSSNSEVKNMLMESYKNKIDFINIQEDELINDNISKVYSYTYSSIHPGLSLQELEEIKNTIESVHNDKYNVPYINVIRGDIIAGIINNLLALYRVNKDPEYKKLAFLLTKNKDLFKDKPNASAKGTIFKQINRRSEELDIILRGVNFLISNLSQGRKPESWRIF